MICPVDEFNAPNLASIAENPEGRFPMHLRFNMDQCPLNICNEDKYTYTMPKERRAGQVPLQVPGHGSFEKRFATLHLCLPGDPIAPTAHRHGEIGRAI